MENIFENGCNFESYSEIDLDYEFDVPKFFDFTTPEADEEISQADLWLQSALGYPPLCELVSKSKSSKCPLQSTLPPSSRLLKPTASYLAKQNLPFTVRSTRSHPRHQNLGSLSSGEIMATKRQKLEVGFLHKYGLLKHQSSFSHKSASKKVAATNDNSSSRQKVTIPKEPELETAHRAQRHRLKKATQQGIDSNSDSCSTRSSLQEVQSHRSTSFSFNYSKCKDFKLCSSRKLSKDPPMEMFEKLSIKSEDQPMCEQKQPPRKMSGASTGKPRRNCKSRSSGGTATTNNGNQSTSVRNR